MTSEKYNRAIEINREIVELKEAGDRLDKDGAIISTLSIRNQGMGDYPFDVHAFKEFELKLRAELMELLNRRISALNDEFESL